MADSEFYALKKSAQEVDAILTGALVKPTQAPSANSLVGVGSDNSQLTIAAGDNITISGSQISANLETRESTVNFTKTGGTNSSTLTGNIRQYGRIYVLTCTVSTDAGDAYETDPGNNVWEGTMPSAYRPPHNIEGMAYYEDAILGLRLQSNGNVTVRLTGSRSKAISGGAFFSVCYFV